jgi:arylsulfatase A-like enzyme
VRRARRAALLLSLGALLGACWGDATQPEAETPRKGRKAGRAGDAEPASPLPDGPRGSGKGPNILMIVWDTVRADHTSLYDYPKPTTPRTAAWAAQSGIRYTRAVSPGVWTLPSHASLFTGLPVRTHGVDADYTRLIDDYTTFAEAFFSAGYDTYAFSANPYIMDSTNLFQGFATVEHPWEKPWKAKVGAFTKGKLIDEDASGVLSPKWTKSAVKQNKYLFKEAGPVASEALYAWIDRREDKARPWFAFVNLMEAHIPRIPSLAARKKVMTDAQIARSYTLPQTTEDFHLYMTGELKYTPDDLATIAAVYDASLVDLDDATGVMLDELRTRGIDKDTIVIVVSDHGESLGDHDLLLHKYAVYDSLSHVPMVISWPGHTPAALEDLSVSTSEALPRAIAMANIPLAPDFLAALAARPAPKQPGAVTEYNAVAKGSLSKLEAQHEGVGLERLERTWRAIELDQWKLSVASDGTKELYDVIVDPRELRNLAARDHATVERIQAGLDAWLAGVPEVDKSKRTGTYTGHQSSEQKSALEALGYLDNDKGD